MNTKLKYYTGKVNIYDFFIKLVLLNAFVSLTAMLYPVWLPLGKILGGLIILILVVIYFNELKHSDILFLQILFIFSILPFVNSTNTGETIQHVLDFLIAMLILWKVANHTFREKLRNILYKSRMIIEFDIKISTVILIISFFIPANYSLSSGERVFSGFSISNHILAGTICFYMALFLIYLDDRKFKLTHLIYFSIYVFTILMTGARTYLITAVFFSIALYMLKLRNYSLRYFVVPAGIVISVYSFLKSSAYSRFISTQQNQYISSNIFEAMTSGRIIWWKIDIDQYMKFSNIEKLFGAGHSNVYEINEKLYGLRIWAHNDFIQVLLAIGVIGLLFYIFVLFRFIFGVRKEGVTPGIKFPTIILIGSFISNIIFNGYYGNLRLIIATVFLSLLLFNKDN